MGEYGTIEFPTPVYNCAEPEMFLPPLPPPPQPVDTYDVAQAAEVKADYSLAVGAGVAGGVNIEGEYEDATGTLAFPMTVDLYLMPINDEAAVAAAAAAAAAQGQNVYA